MNKILTDEEITLIIRECARGSAINRDGSTSHRIARAIEQAVLNKLGEQEPVAWLHQTRTSSDVITDEVKMFLLRQYERWEFHSSMQRPSVCKAENYTKPLYLHPLPRPDLVAEIERLKALNVELTAKCNWYNADGARLERERDYHLDNAKRMYVECTELRQQLSAAQTSEASEWVPLILLKEIKEANK